MTGSYLYASSLADVAQHLRDTADHDADELGHMRAAGYEEHELAPVVRSVECLRRAARLVETADAFERRTPAMLRRAAWSLLGRVLLP